MVYQLVRTHQSSRPQKPARPSVYVRKFIEKAIEALHGVVVKAKEESDCTGHVRVVEGVEK